MHCLYHHLLNLRVARTCFRLMFSSLYLYHHSPTLVSGKNLLQRAVSYDLYHHPRTLVSGKNLFFYELLCSIRIFYNAFLTTSKMVSTCPKAPMQIWANCQSIIFYVYGCTEISDVCCANSSFHRDPNQLQKNLCNK